MDPQSEAIWSTVITASETLKHEIDRAEWREDRVQLQPADTVRPTIRFRMERGGAPPAVVIADLSMREDSLIVLTVTVLEGQDLTTRGPDATFIATPRAGGGFEFLTDSGQRIPDTEIAVYCLRRGQDVLAGL